MKNITRIQVAIAVLGISGLLGFGHLLANLSTVNEIFGSFMQANPTGANSFIALWIVAPALQLLVAVLLVVPQIELHDRIKLVALTAASVVAIAIWLYKTSVNAGGFFNEYFATELFESRVYGESGVQAFASLGALSHIIPFVTLVIVALEFFGIKSLKLRNSGLSRFVATLLDGKLENFISRKVSGVLYLITAWLLIVAAGLVELGLMLQVFQGNFIALLAMLLVPVALLLILIVVRMAYEMGIALIVVAENTKK